MEGIIRPINWLQVLLGGLVLAALTLLLGLKTPAAVVALLVGIPVMLNPEIGLLIMIAAFPIETAGRFTDITSVIQVSIAQVAGAATLFSWLIHFVFKEGKVFFTWSYVILAAIAILTLLSATLAPVQEVGVFEFVRLLTNVAFYFLITTMVDSEKLLRKVLAIVILTGVLVSVSAIYVHYRPAQHSHELDFQKIQSGAIRFNDEAAIGEIVRASGLQLHPDKFAIYLMLPIGIALYQLRSRRSPRIRILIYMALIILLWGLAVSYSRIGAFCLGLLILLYLIGRVLEISPALVFYVLLIGLVGLLVPKYWLRIGSVKLYGESTSVTIRAPLAKGSIRMFQDNWVIGVGLGNFPYNLLRYTPELAKFHIGDLAVRLKPGDKSAITKMVGFGSHNSYLEIAAELGIIGIALFSAFTMATFLDFHAAQRIFNAKGHYLFLLQTRAFQSILIVLLFTGLFHSVLSVKAVWFTYALAVVSKNIALSAATNEAK